MQNICSSNLLPNDIENIVKFFIDKLISKKEIVGICLLGGLGKRNYFDQYSDVDFAIFIDDITLAPEYLPPFEFVYYYNNQKLLFNVHQQGLKQEKKACWDLYKREAYSKAIVAYDPTGKVSKLINSKIKLSEKEKFEYVIKAFGQIPWYIDLNVETAIKRGLYMPCNDLLSRGLEMIINVLYIVNNEFPPHAKWFYHRCLSLGLRPHKLKEIINHSLTIKDMSLGEIKRRKKVINSLFKQVQVLARKSIKNLPEDCYLYACRHLYSRQANAETLADKYVARSVAKGEKINKEIYGDICLNLALCDKR